MRLFNFTKSLEEIDEMDTGRLTAAMTAGDIERWWDKPLKDLDGNQILLRQEMLRLIK